MGGGIYMYQCRHDFIGGYPVLKVSCTSESADDSEHGGIHDLHQQSQAKTNFNTLKVFVI